MPVSVPKCTVGIKESTEELSGGRISEKRLTTEHDYGLLFFEGWFFLSRTISRKNN